MSDELKSCPFCGCKTVKLLMQTAWYDEPRNKGKKAVICTNCGATMYGCDNYEAADKWNRRFRGDNNMCNTGFIVCSEEDWKSEYFDFDCYTTFSTREEAVHEKSRLERDDLIGRKYLIIHIS